MDGVVGIRLDRTQLIDWLAEHVQHAAESRASHRNGNRCAGVDGLHAAHHAFGWFHGDRAHPAFTEVLLHFRGHIQWFGKVEALARNPQRGVNRRKVPLLELYVEHRPDHLDHVSNMLFRHHFSYAVDEAPLTISIISLVMAACRTLFMCSVSASMTSPAFLVAASMAVMRAACSAAQDSSMLRSTCVST